MDYIKRENLPNFGHFDPVKTERCYWLAVGILMEGDGVGIVDVDTQPFIGLLTRMETREGTLTCYWSDTPLSWDVEALHRAWTLLDPCDIVEHYYEHTLKKLTPDEKGVLGYKPSIWD